MVIVQQIKCPSCNANIEYDPGKDKHCRYCGAILAISDENRHEVVYNDVAEVKRVELDEKRLQYTKEKDEQDRNDRKEQLERIRRNETFRIRAISFWIGISVLLFVLGIVGIYLDVKPLIVLLGISSVSLGIYVFAFNYRKHKNIWKLCLGIVLFGVLISWLYYKKAPVNIEMPKEYVADLDDFLPEISAVELQNLLSTIGEFATSEYVYSGYAQIEKYREIGGWEVPGTSHKIGIYYNGKIKVGYNVSDITISVDDRTIIVKIPEPKILDNYIENYKTEEDNNIFNPIDSSEVGEKLEDVKLAELNKAIKDGVYTKAESSVKVLITDLFKNIEKSTIVFE